MIKLRDLSNDELLARLRAHLGRGNVWLAGLLAYLGEVDARRLYAEHACTSMWDFCFRKLGMSESEAVGSRRPASSERFRSHGPLLDHPRTRRWSGTVISACILRAAAGCGGDIAAVRDAGTSSSSEDGARDGGFNVASSATTTPDAAAPDWEDDPATLRPERGDCLARPLGACVDAGLFDHFADEVERCAPPHSTCGWMNYALDEDGCLRALAPEAPLSRGDERAIKACLVEEISRKRWPCAAGARDDFLVGSCSLQK